MVCMTDMTPEQIDLIEQHRQASGQFGTHGHSIPEGALADGAAPLLDDLDSDWRRHHAATQEIAKDFPAAAATAFSTAVPSARLVQFEFVYDPSEGDRSMLTPTCWEDEAGQSHHIHWGSEPDDFEGDDRAALAAARDLRAAARGFAYDNHTAELDGLEKVFVDGYPIYQLPTEQTDPGARSLEDVRSALDAEAERRASFLDESAKRLPDAMREIMPNAESVYVIWDKTAVNDENDMDFRPWARFAGMTVDGRDVAMLDDPNDAEGIEDPVVREAAIRINELLAFAVDDVRQLDAAPHTTAHLEHHYGARLIPVSDKYRDFVEELNFVEDLNAKKASGA